MTTELKPPAKPVIFIHGGKVYKTVSGPLFDGVEEIPGFDIKTEEPKFLWKGKKIPFDLWATVVSFMRWSYTTHKEEAMVTFFYKPDTGEWAAWAFAQRMAGLAVNYIADHPTVAADRAQFGKGWIQFGSLHHHCTLAAFASGTDKTDEVNKEGIHFTLGKLDQPILDIHCRQVFGNFVQDVHQTRWVEKPEWTQHIPDYIKIDATNHALKAVAGTPFPDVWKERIVKHVPFVYQGQNNTLPHQGNSGQQTQANGAGANGVGSGTTEYYIERKKRVMQVIQEHEWDFDNVYYLVVRGYAHDTPQLTEEQRAKRWDIISTFDKEPVFIPQVFLTRLLKEIMDERKAILEEERQRTLAEAYGYDQ
jgi:hypothetical protein